MSLGGPAKTTGLKRVWLSESLGRSLPSVRTARNTSSVNHLSKAPSGTVRVTPRSGKVNTAPEWVTEAKVKLSGSKVHELRDCL